MIDKQRITETIDKAILNLEVIKKLTEDSADLTKEVRLLVNIEDVPPVTIPDPVTPPPNPEPIPIPIPIPIPVPTPTNPTELRPIPEPLVDLSGLTAEVFDGNFKALENVTENKLFSINKSVEIKEEVNMPKNIRFVFGTKGKVKVSAKCWWKSQIVANQKQKIFEVADGVEFKLLPDATHIVPLDWFTNSYNEVIQMTDFIGTYLIPFTDHDNGIELTETLSFVSHKKPNAVVYNSWELFGYKTNISSDTRQGVSILNYKKLEKPAINSRGNRWLSRFENFQVKGPNTKPRAILDQSDRKNIRNWEPEYWAVDGLSLHRNDHQSGFAIDYAPDDPKSEPFSAQVSVRNVTVQGHAVGFSVSPSAFSAQADTLFFDGVKADGCVVGFSIGQDQTRSTEVRKSMFDAMHTIFTNNKFGKQIGSKFNIITTQCTNALKVFQMTTDRLGNCFIDGCYFEHVGVIGSITAGGNNSGSVYFRGCNFVLDDDGYSNDNGYNWSAPYTTLQGGGNILFEATDFRSTRGFLAMSTGQNGRITFRNCNFHDIYEFMFDGVLSTDRMDRVSFVDCNWFYGGERDNQTDLNDIPLVIGGRKYVRWGIGEVQVLENDAYTRRKLTRPFQTNTSAMFPPLTEEPDRVFTIPTTNANMFVVGMFAGGFTQGNLDGMMLDNQELQVPCLQVVEVAEDSVTFKKLGPDVKMTSNSNWWGAPYLHNRCIALNRALKLTDLVKGDCFNDEDGVNWIGNNGSPVRDVVGKIRHIAE